MRNWYICQKKRVKRSLTFITDYSALVDEYPGHVSSKSAGCGDKKGLKADNTEDAFGEWRADRLFDLTTGPDVYVEL